jgi:hypothetical protein
MTRYKVPYARAIGKPADWLALAALLDDFLISFSQDSYRTFISMAANPRLPKDKCQ